ncbi:hypothetical protein [Nonomuraea longicatena]|uniref:Uncharacterized protein n=1 Tax=Nonomuraea longicatena TaxID=83682 RepID=A0ABP4B033_9ACTN
MAAYGSRDEQGTIDKALQMRIRRCMTVHGFTYRHPAISTTHRPTPGDDESWGGHFRLDLTNDDLTRSRREGYGLYRSADQAAAPEELNTAYLRSLSPDRRKAWDKAMLGDGGTAKAAIPGMAQVAVPAEGCIGAAHAELYGDLQTFIRASGVVNGLGIPLKGQWSKDPQVLAAAESWRRCMGSKGFWYKVWGDAWNAAAEIYQDENVPRRQPHPEEIRIATADAECSVQTGKSRVERDRFTYYQQRAPTEWAPQIGQYRQIREAALIKARTVLSETQG